MTSRNRASVSPAPPGPASRSARVTAAAFSASASATCLAWSVTPSRWVRQACATFRISCRKRSRGKYVPAKNGLWSGVMNTVIGQPPWPVMAWVAVM